MAMFPSLYLPGSYKKAELSISRLSSFDGANSTLPVCMSSHRPRPSFLFLLPPSLAQYLQELYRSFCSIREPQMTIIMTDSYKSNASEIAILFELKLDKKPWAINT